MITIRPHILRDGGALDLRTIRENFLWCGRQLSNIEGHQIAMLQFGRTSFEGNAFEDYFFRLEDNVQYRTPNQGSWAPGSDVDIQHYDGALEGTMAWSIALTAADTDCSAVWACPYFQGQALWSGEDKSFTGTQFSYTGRVDADILDPLNDRVTVSPWGVGDKLTLGAQTGFTARGGSGLTGLLVVGIGGVWRVTSSSMVIRILNR